MHEVNPGYGNPPTWKSPDGKGAVLYDRFDFFGRPSERQKELTPENVLNGSIFPILLDQKLRAEDANCELWYRQIDSGYHSDLATPIGAKVAPEYHNGTKGYVLDIRDAGSRAKRLEVHTRLREGVDSLEGGRWAGNFFFAIDYGAGVTNENRFPFSSYIFPEAAVQEDLENFVSVWGRRTCVNLGGPSAFFKPFLAYAGAMRDGDGTNGYIIQAVRHDGGGRGSVDGGETYQGENFASLYRDALDAFGSLAGNRDPLVKFIEAWGGPNKYYEQGVPVEAFFRELYELMRVLYWANMGAACTYPEYPKLVEKVNEYAAIRFGAYKVHISDEPAGGDGGNPTDPTEPTDLEARVTELEYAVETLADRYAEVASFLSLRTKSFDDFVLEAKEYNVTKRGS